MNFCRVSLKEEAMSVIDESPVQFDSRHQWDINDSNMPRVLDPDQYEDWPSGHCKYAYLDECNQARKHSSGWAMRNTNNHNVNILKKSCLGVLVCNRNCTADNGDKVHLRPAICDKARKKQLGKACSNRKCDGHLELQACGGHCGYPVTHFWRHTNGLTFFQAKGVHDHPQPGLKSCAKSKRYYSKDSSRFSTEATKKGVKRPYDRIVNDHDYVGRIPKVQIVEIKPINDYSALPGFQFMAQSSSEAAPVPDHADMWSAATKSLFDLSDFPSFDFGVEQSHAAFNNQCSQDSGYYPDYSNANVMPVNDCFQVQPSYFSTSVTPISESTRASSSSPTSSLDESTVSGRSSPTSSSGGDAHSLYSTTDARGPFWDDMDELGFFDSVDKITAGGFDLNSLLDLPAIESILGEDPTLEKAATDFPYEQPVAESSLVWGNCKMESSSRGLSPDHSLSELKPFKSVAQTSADIYSSSQPHSNCNYMEPLDTGNIFNMFKDISVNFSDIFSC